MNSAKVSIVQNPASHFSSRAPILHGGTVVSGRVLSSNGGGSYTVSLAGQMIEVKSEAKLEAGQVFQARVKIEGGKVALSLLQESKSSGGLVQKFSVQNQNLSPQLSNFLSSLGFEPNSDSFRILQFMQQLGMKIDVPAAKKALHASKKGGETDTEKAQVSLLLDEKGIPSDEEKIKAVIGRNPENKEDTRKRKNQNEKLKIENGKLKIRDANLKLEKDIVKSYFSQVDSASLSHKAGLLSAFNTVLSSPSKNPPLRHWILLPFEWNFRNYAGDIRLLFDSDLKNLEKVIVNLENESKKRIFLLSYKGGNVDSVKFASSVESDSYEINLLSSLICTALGDKVAVSSAALDELRGFCAGDEAVKFVRGIL